MRDESKSKGNRSCQCGVLRFAQDDCEEEEAARWLPLLLLAMLHAKVYLK
jgi:hypothetical protein